MSCLPVPLRRPLYTPLQTRARTFCAGLLALFSVAWLTACGSPPPQVPPPAPTSDPVQVVWPMDPSGLRYTLQTDEKLNAQHNRALGLTICVYQLKEPESFLQLAATSAGVVSLLECGVDKAAAVSAQSYALQPGERRSITTSRSQNAKFLAVVAGYAHLKPELCAVVWPYPMHTETQGLIFRDTVYSAARVDALISFGSEALTITGVERVR